MMAILNRHGNAAPIVVCDICRRRITDYEAAASVFLSPGLGHFPDGTFTPLLHAHKGRCHDLAEERLGGRLETGWHELLWDLVWTPQNSGHTWEEFLEDAGRTELMAGL